MAENVVIVRLQGDATGLKKAIDDVDRELGQLVVQTDRAQAALGQGLARGTQRATKGMNQYTAAQNKAFKESGRLRAGFQNVGYQLQDTVVQLEMGTHWTRVLGQQGSQVAGIFGNPWITIMAAAGGAVLALATSAGVFKAEMISATEATDDLIESLDDLKDAREALGEGRGDTGPFATALRQLQEITESKAVDDLNSQFKSLLNTMQSANEDESIGLLQRIIMLGTGDAMRAAEAQKVIQAIDADTQALAESLEDVSRAASGTDLLNAYAAAVIEAEELFGTNSDIYQSLIDMVPAVEAMAEEMSRWKQTSEDELAIMKGMPVVIKLSTEAEKERSYWADYTAAALARQQTAYADIRKEQERLAMAEAGRAGLLAGAGPDQARQAMQDRYWVGPPTTEPDDPKPRRGADREAEEMLKSIEKQTEALRKANEQAKLFGGNMAEAFGQQGVSAIDSFIDGLASAETNWGQFAENLLRDLAKMVLRAAILQALMASFGGVAGAPVGFVQTMIQSMAGVAFAKGGVFDKGSVTPFAKGGIVGGPTMFPMTNGTGLMGEAGPEAIMPLSRDSQGKLGVAGPNITINNNAGVDVAVVRSDEELIEIAVNRSVKKVQGDFSQSMSTGQGSYSRALEQGYNARRRAT